MNIPSNKSECSFREKGSLTLPNFTTESHGMQNTQRTEADGEEIRRVNSLASHSPKVVCNSRATERGKTAAPR